MLKCSKLIVPHLPINDLYVINIIETKNNLNQLNTNPLITLIMALEIREDMAQHKAASIAKK